MNDAVRQALEGLDGLQAIELSHPLEERMPSFPNHPLFFKMRWQPLGEPAVVHQLIMCDHTGTHVDAPSHFPAGPQDAERSIDRWDPLHLVGHAVCVRVGPFEPVNAVIAVDAITAWERTHLPIAEGDIVLFDYRWAGGWATGAAAADFARDWPGLGRSAVDYLVERGVRAGARGRARAQDRVDATATTERRRARGPGRIAWTGTARGGRSRAFRRGPRRGRMPA